MKIKTKSITVSLECRGVDGLKQTEFTLIVPDEYGVNERAEDVFNVSQVMFDTAFPVQHKEIKGL